MTKKTVARSILGLVLLIAFIVGKPMFIGVLIMYVFAGLIVWSMHNAW